MKKSIFITAVALAWGINLGANQALAGNNYGQGMNSQSTNCQISTDICAGETSVISGTISAIGLTGQGLQIDDGTEIITVYGLGPQRFWDLINVDKPTVGEQVTLETSTIVFSDDSEKSIVLNVTINGVTIDLRDDACQPLWRMMGGKRISALGLTNEIIARGGRGGGNGPGDGSGNGGNGPGDGTGNGPGTGECVNG